jgi:hypothetical protein
MKEKDRKRLEMYAAEVLLRAAIKFLLQHRIPADWIATQCAELVRKEYRDSVGPEFRRQYDEYRDMGTILAAWYNMPKYLDPDGRPIALPVSGKRRASVRTLITDASVSLDVRRAVELLKASPSIRRVKTGEYRPRRQVFALRRFELPRAANTVARYLSTLSFNEGATGKGLSKMLERDCSATGLSLKSIQKIQREIRARGKPFVDAIDHELEFERRRNRRKFRGEVGLLVFSWANSRPELKKGARRRRRKS